MEVESLEGGLILVTVLSFSASGERGDQESGGRPNATVIRMYVSPSTRTLGVSADLRLLTR